MKEEDLTNLLIKRILAQTNKPSLVASTEEPAATSTLSTGNATVFHQNADAITRQPVMKVNWGRIIFLFLGVIIVSANLALYAVASRRLIAAEAAIADLAKTKENEIHDGFASQEALSTLSTAVTDQLGEFRKNLGETTASANEALHLANEAIHNPPMVLKGKDAIVFDEMRFKDVEARLRKIESTNQ